MMAFVTGAADEQPSFDCILAVKLERSGHASPVARLSCEDAKSGQAWIVPRALRAGSEPLLLSLPEGELRVIVDGLPRAGDRGHRFATCGRAERTVRLRAGESTRLELNLHSLPSAELIVTVVDVDRALRRALSPPGEAHPDGLWLHAPGRVPRELVFHRPDQPGANLGTWRPWDPEHADEVSGPVPPGEYTLCAAHAGRWLGKVAVRLEDHTVGQVEIRVE